MAYINKCESRLYVCYRCWTKKKAPIFIKNTFFLIEILKIIIRILKLDENNKFLKYKISSFFFNSIKY